MGLHGDGRLGHQLLHHGLVLRGRADLGVVHLAGVAVVPHGDGGQVDVVLVAAVAVVVGRVCAAASAVPGVVAAVGGLVHQGPGEEDLAELFREKMCVGILSLANRHACDKISA